VSGEDERVTRSRQQSWRLWSGCCEPFVLWGPDGQGVPVERAPVSPALQAELLQWHRHVAEHVDGDAWDSAEAERLHANRGRALQRWLARELDEPVDLDLSAARVGW
jgi:hypothetical protein